MLQEKIEGETVYWYGEVTSTMDAAAQLLKEGKTGLVVAETQTAGRGRYGRRWESPDGGLYLSWIVAGSGRPAETFTRIAAIAVVDALHILGIPPCLLKYPNDIIVSGRKIAGILVENKSDAVIVGIGVNLNNTGREIGNQAVSCRDILGKHTDRADAVRLLIVSLHATSAAYDRDGALGVRRWSSLLTPPAADRK